MARIDARASAAPPPPVIVLHGLTASVLRDECPLDPETVFSRQPLGPTEWNRILLHPDAPSFEANEPARVRVSHPVPIGYAELVKALRSELAPAEDQPVPVYPFAYDWRDSVFVSAERLGALIREVIGRTRLLKHYPSDLAVVDLVGHSMGGLVISACLARGHHIEGGRPLVRRVATIGTPYRWAVDALEKLAVGESELFGEGRDSERQAAFATLSDWLAEGKKVQAAVNELDPKAALLDNAGPGRHPGFLVMTGLDEPTKYQASLGVLNGERIFEFASEKDGYDPDGDDDPTGVAALVDRRSRLGDNTVPIRGAVPAWADRERVVCFARRDFGTLENFPLKGFASFHAILPWLNLVHRWIIAFFKDKDAGKATITARPLFDVPSAAWQSPVSGAALKPWLLAASPGLLGQSASKRLSVVPL